METVTIIVSFAAVFFGNFLWRKQRFQISQGTLPKSYGLYGIQVYIFGILAAGGIVGLILTLGLWKGLLVAFVAGFISSLSQK